MYLVLPVWFAAGFADYLCHRAALIERTSGPKESLLHLGQFAPVGLPLLAVLFLEVNAGVILLMAVCLVLHQASAIWDVRYANLARRVSPTEQHLHGVLEAVPVPVLKVPWSHFGDRHPQAHLVVASLPAAQEVGNPDVKATQYVLERLIRSQVPVGDYATTVDRQAGQPEVHLAFEKEGDAQKLSDAVRAGVTDRYPGWATQRAFELDGETIESLAAGLPPPRTNSRSRKD